MGFSRFNSRVFTNSFTGQNKAAYSSHILTGPQYSHQAYYQLSSNVNDAGSRQNKWLRANGLNAPFTRP